MIRIKSLASAMAFSVLFLALSGFAYAGSVTSTVYLATEQGNGMSVGTVTFTDTAGGLEIKTDLKGLPPGEHGFHVHEKGDCGPVEKDGKKLPAMAAGGHFDPAKAGKHAGPEKDGHKGDLPKLIVNTDGTAKVTLSVKNVMADEFKGRSVMIHGGGDNYSDDPLPLGGGGARIACGLIN